MIPPGTIQRAFELAREGECRTLADIRRRLALEHYPSVDAHLAGSGIRRQLSTLMRDCAASAGT